MGYGMAVNLRKKLPKDVTLYICDVNDKAITRFQAETINEGPVRVVQNAFEAMNVAVRCQVPHRDPY